MFKVIREGEIVLVEGLDEYKDGIIGQVVSYDAQKDILILGWPEKLSPYNGSNPQSFSSPDGVFFKTRKLSDEEIFKKMLELRAQTIKRIKEGYQQAAAKVANDELHI